MKIFVLIFILVFFQLTLKAQIKTAGIGNFKLENGSQIFDCKIGYQTFGKLNSEKSNAILFPSWFGGTTKGLANLITNWGILDTSKYFVILVDAFGDGISSSPSNSLKQPLDSFPVFNIRDMVNSQHKFLIEKFGMKHLYGILGGSMGGIQVLQWIVSYPEFMDKALSYVGSPKLASSDLLLWQAELNAIDQGRKCSNSEEDILETVAAIQTYAIQTPEYRSSHTSPDSFDIFMDKTYDGLRNNFNSYNWESQLKAIMSHDISKHFGSMQKAAETVKAKTFIIVSLQDHVVNPKPAMEFAKMINAQTYEFDNNCGHLAPGCEKEIFINLINNFFND